MADTMHVVVHNAISVDGRIDGFVPDIALYYQLAGTWDIDAHLVGADTLIEGEQAAGGTSDADSASSVDMDPEVGTEDQSLLVVTDSKGRIAGWESIRNQPFWGDVIVLCTEVTPEDYLANLDQIGIPYVIRGDDQVDLHAAFDELRAREIETILVDSGGSLNGALLRGGLVDEVSILVHPTVVGGTSARSFIRGPDPTDGGTDLNLLDVEQPSEDLVWLRYGIVE